MLDAVLLLKVGLAPLLILAASYAGYRWGHTVSGWIVGLPLVSAPVILLLALERGNPFAAASAQGSMMGIISLTTFSLTYSFLSLRRGVGWVPSLLLGWGAYFVLTWLLGYASASIFVAFVGVAAWLLLMTRVFPKATAPAVEKGDGFPWGDALIRVVAAVALIFAITEYAPALGPTLSGLLTPFPIYTSVMVTSIHRKQGAAAATEFVRGSTISSLTPAAFWLIVGSTIVQYGIIVSYAIAIVVSLALHWALLRVLRKTT
jgi:hypothetical protein